MPKLSMKLAAQMGQMSKAISENANRRIKKEIQTIDKDAALIQRLRRMPQSVLRLLTGSWRPFKPDLGGMQGIKISIRSTDAVQLDTDAAQRQMIDVVIAATQDTIAADPKSFLEPVLQDYFTNPDPYFPVQTKSVKKKRASVDPRKKPPKNPPQQGTLF